MECPPDARNRAREIMASNTGRDWRGATVQNREDKRRPLRRHSHSGQFDRGERCLRHVGVVLAEGAHRVTAGSARQKKSKPECALTRCERACPWGRICPLLAQSTSSAIAFCLASVLLNQHRANTLASN